MKSKQLNVLGLVGMAALLLSPILAVGGGKTPQTGPATEKRFPPLQVPAGFKATLFACDPLVEYPSVISIGPRRRSFFLAQDFMTGLGREIVRRDEIRLVEDTDGDGYADKSTLYAKGFNSIQGLAYHAGTVYAMHAPLLTALRDTDGDGKADERRDLLSGLGLTPEDNPPRLHCANGVVVGHDGWLYLAVGDHGCDVRRPEGDRFVFHGGGILRCRRDGRDLHLFAYGMRNIYDVALDDELNVFVRDNENDGGDYMIRVCHSFHGADHGYPYLYYERPEEAMPPLADLGRGSSAGGACYLETAFPAQYRGSLFFCEWGRSVVNYRRQRLGSSFAPMKETDFAAGAEADPYGFKPTDLIVDRDGSLLVSDWADGQRPKRGRARIYRISYVGEMKSDSKVRYGGKASTQGRPKIDDWIAQLDSKSYHARFEAQEVIVNKGNAGVAALKSAVGNGRLGVHGRMHAVWALAGLDEQNSIGDLFRIAETDSEPRVRAQAVRALADLTDPVLAKHRLDAGRGDAEIAARLAAIASGNDQDPRVVFEVVVALGRLRWAEAPNWFRQHVTKVDPALAHAIMQTLRRAENWPDVLKLLDEPNSSPIRTIALRAIANLAQTTVVDGLIDRLKSEPNSRRRAEYADVLTRVYKKPNAWVYWGYRPAPRPANPVAWERTEAIERTLDRVLAKSTHKVRTATLRRMQREQVPARLETLARSLQQERDTDAVAAILDSLKDRPFNEIEKLLAGVVSETKHAVDGRLAALAILTKGLNVADEGRMLELAEQMDDGPVLAAMLRELGLRPKLASSRLLLRKLKSPKTKVRAAAIESLAKLNVTEAAQHVPSLLNESDIGVRRAAAAAAGQLAVRDAVVPLLKTVRDADPELRRLSLDSLRQLREPSAVGHAVEALNHPQTQLAALDYLREFGDPSQLADLAKTAAASRSIEVLSRIVRVLSIWQDRHPKSREKLERAISAVHGNSGLLLRWTAIGPVSSETATRVIESNWSGSSVPSLAGGRPVFATGTDAIVSLGRTQQKSAKSIWLALNTVYLTERTAVELLASSSGTLEIWLNGRSVYKRGKATTFQPNSDRVEATMVKGENRLLVQVVSATPAARFHVRVRRKSSTAEHERLTKLLLHGRGNLQRGREVFAKAEKSLCIKCHRFGENGGRIGPELTGIGSRFSKIHLIESLLEPSRTIAPSYGTVVAVLASGRVVTGVKISETDQVLTVGDAEGKTHVIAKSEIEERSVQTKSTMPDGIEKRLSERELIDLVAFLVSQKK